MGVCELILSPLLLSFLTSKQPPEAWGLTLDDTRDTVQRNFQKNPQEDTGLSRAT